MLRTLSVGLALVLLSGCDSAGRSAPAMEPAPAPPYRAVANLKQTMEQILDPAADVIWDSAGFIITAEGEPDLAPTTDQGWEHVRNSAPRCSKTAGLTSITAPESNRTRG